TRRNARGHARGRFAMRGAGRSLSFAIVAIILAVSCGGGTGGGGGGGPLTKVRLQLQWVAQSQFAGYYAALDKGYFKDLGLDVEIKLGGPDIVPQQVVASDAAEFGIAWVPKMLASREAGADLVNIAQVFQRSGTLEVSFKEKNITKPEDWKGKKVGTWGFGNEPELYAAMRKVGIDPTKASDVNIVAQPFDMSLLLNGQVDAAQAMIYNEYAQVLEQKNPKTGQLYTPAELTVITSTTYQVLKSKPADAAFRTDLAKKAADALKSAGADINGSGFKKATVQVTPGGN